MYDDLMRRKILWGRQRQERDEMEMQRVVAVVCVISKTLLKITKDICWW